LVSPDFSAAPHFGQPMIQTSEPCGKRSLVGGRLIATSISAVIRAFSHAAETRNDAAVGGNYAPSPSKAARTILTTSNQVKIAPQPYKLLIQLSLWRRSQTRGRAVAAVQQLCPVLAKYGHGLRAGLSH
jgi:hypothetical protein